MKSCKVECGEYRFYLDDILKEKNISINKLTKDTNTDFKVVKRILTGSIVRIDVSVLARLCGYLHCEVTDVIKFFPDDKTV